MNKVSTLLITEAVFSDDGKRRYLLRKVWDETKPDLAILMLAPSEASGIVLDTTTQLVLNNASRLGYGKVSVLNLFSCLGNGTWKEDSAEDVENLKIISEAIEKADAIIYAPGIGKRKNKLFQQRQERVLRLLLPFEKKLFCLCNKGQTARLQHPLSPAVRVWYLSEFRVEELLPQNHTQQEKQKTNLLSVPVSNKPKRPAKATDKKAP